MRGRGRSRNCIHIGSFGTAVDAAVAYARHMQTLEQSGGGGGAVGLGVEDCNRCVYCLDKPRNGGPGRKRQKCVLKGTPARDGEESGS